MISVPWSKGLKIKAKVEDIVHLKVFTVVFLNKRLRFCLDLNIGDEGRFSIIIDSSVS